MPPALRMMGLNQLDGAVFRKCCEQIRLRAISRGDGLGVHLPVTDFSPSCGLPLFDDSFLAQRQQAGALSRESENGLVILKRMSCEVGDRTLVGQVIGGEISIRIRGHEQAHVWRK